VQRGGAKLDVALTAAPLTPERSASTFQSATGLDLSELSPAEARRAGVEAPRGLVAVDQVRKGSLAQRGGLRRGDIVVAVNSAEVDTLKDFQKAIAQARKSGRAVLLVQRGYQLMELALELG
jgi:S1-C subfamily serine protease